MMLFWFIDGFVVLLVALAVLLVVRQRRSYDFDETIDSRDLPSDADPLARQFQAGVHRGGGNGAGPTGF